jgi:arabinose-5-phosphate isomerase
MLKNKIFLLKKLFNKQLSEFNSLNLINYNEILLLINLIKNRKGNIIFTGIGKSGFVAEHVSSTFNSISIKSVFINPVNCLHGDLGFISNNDIIICISKSGNTEELLKFVQLCKTNNKAQIVLIHSNNKVNLIKEKVDHSIFIPVKKELDDFNIIPTISSIIYLAFLQCIGLTTIDVNESKLQKFFKNHPGGSIGTINQKLQKQK